MPFSVFRLSTGHGSDKSAAVIEHDGTEDDEHDPGGAHPDLRGDAARYEYLTVQTCTNRRGGEHRCLADPAAGHGGDNDHNEAHISKRSRTLFGIKNTGGGRRFITIWLG